MKKKHPLNGPNRTSSHVENWRTPYREWNRPMDISTVYSAYNNEVSA